MPIFPLPAVIRFCPFTTGGKPVYNREKFILTEGNMERKTLENSKEARDHAVLVGSALAGIGR